MCQWNARPFRIPPQPHISYSPLVYRYNMYKENADIIHRQKSNPNFSLTIINIMLKTSAMIAP